MRVRPLSQEAYLRLIRTARRQEPATLWIHGAQVLNVYTREWLSVHVVLSGERIAYVGEAKPLVDDHTVIVDGSGYWLVPGYIEPHAHPFIWYSPDSLSDYALATGTTTLVSDTLILTASLPHEQVESILNRLSEHPVKQFFWARLDPQIRQSVPNEAFSKAGLARLLEHPLVLQGGELTDWTGFLEENEDILFGMKHSRDRGKKIEGHHPGASANTLAVAAAGGVTACHESIVAEEVLHRLRMGMYATLRHSSIRPDLPDLIYGMQRLGIPFSSRLMFTSDGTTPPTLRHGLTDFLIRTAIDAGLSPADAYTIASLNPAHYYGLDAEIGGIAPGRIADILFLRSPEEPTPQKVIANGTMWAEQGTLLQQTAKVDWGSYSFPQIGKDTIQVKTSWFTPPRADGAVPVIQLENAVITRLIQDELPTDAEGRVDLSNRPELASIISIDPVEKRLTQAIVRGFATELEALACSFTVANSFLVIGRNPDSMKRALERMLELGGGLVAVEEGQVCFELSLELAGKMTNAGMGELIEKGEAFVRFMRSKGYVHDDPIYSLFFFNATHLPYIRLSTEGVYDVMQRKIIHRSRSLFENE